jgi:hypothetical protein
MIDCHGITEQQWMEFSEGSSGVSEIAAWNAEIAAHVEECAECSKIYRELNEWNAQLTEEGRLLRAALELPEAAWDRMLAESLARVSAMPARGRGAGEAIASLRALLSPVFGAGTVRATVEAALQGAAPDGICGANWRAFAAKWSEAIQSICGLAAGHLAERVALSLAITN